MKCLLTILIMLPLFIQAQRTVYDSVAYFVSVGAVANGSCSITVGNTSAGSLSQAIVLNFAVIKSVAN